MTNLIAIKITAWTEIHGSIRANVDVDADDDIDHDKMKAKT